MSFGGPDQVCALAAMILSDAELEITADAINTLLKATGNNEVPVYWPTLMAGFLKNGKAEELILTGGAAGGGGGGGGAAAAGGGDGAAAEVEEEKPKEEEVDPMEGGMDMFGGGGDY